MNQFERGDSKTKHGRMDETQGETVQTTSDRHQYQLRIAETEDSRREGRGTRSWISRQDADSFCLLLKARI